MPLMQSFCGSAPHAILSSLWYIILAEQKNKINKLVNMFSLSFVDINPLLVGAVVFAL